MSDASKLGTHPSKSMRSKSNLTGASPKKVQTAARVTPGRGSVTSDGIAEEAVVAVHSPPAVQKLESEAVPLTSYPLCTVRVIIDH